MSKELNITAEKLKRVAVPRPAYVLIGGDKADVVKAMLANGELRVLDATRSAADALEKVDSGEAVTFVCLMIK